MFLGASEALIDTYRNATTVEYEKDDENWTMTVSTDTIPKPVVYTFKMGEEYVSQDIQGKSMKVKMLM